MASRKICPFRNDECLESECIMWRENIRNGLDECAIKQIEMWLDNIENAVLHNF